METTKILENLKFFFPYITKSKVTKELSTMGKFPNFNTTYSQINEDNEEPAWYKTCATLVEGIKQEIITESDLDELLFYLIEDDLLNSYLYRLDSYNLSVQDLDAVPKILQSWEAPDQNVLLENVRYSETNSRFLICGYRTVKNQKELASIRLLLLDNGYVKIIRNGNEHKIVYPTIIDFDFENKLLHIRIKDVDNIQNNKEEISTYQGRVNNTLDFVSGLKPSISYSKFSDFRTTLFTIEEHVLKPKRDLSHEKLETFETSIKAFAKEVNNYFSPPEDRISSYEYISFAVLSIISTTINTNELGEIVGIRFRNIREEQTNKYAEVYITDREYRCISTNELYWLNLPILLEQRKVEFLKIGKSLPSGFAIFNLEISLDTANIRLLKRSSHYEEDLDRQPSDEKYIDTVNFILPFLSNK